MASYSFDELLETQMNDEDISLIIKYLNNKESYVNVNRRFKRFISCLLLVDGVLYYKRREKYLFVCPEVLRAELLQFSHAEFYSGHQGMFKTHQRLLQSVWWPGMFQDIENYVKNCKI